MPASAAETFSQLAATPDERIDLAHAALSIAEVAEPHLDRELCLQQLDALAAAAGNHLRAEATEAGRVEALMRWLHDEQGFRGNDVDYYDPRNSFLNQVLARRTGIPITLALVYIEVGKRLGITLAGVNFPGHFLVRHVAPGPEIVIDPFGGRILSEEDCAGLLRSVMGPSAVLEPALLRPVPAKSMLRRMLTNLKLIYLRLGQLSEALACMDRILLLAPEEPQELRDRGLLHYHLDRYAEARADLERFLTLMPQHPGADAVQPYLERARQRMSRLN